MSEGIRRVVIGLLCVLAVGFWYVAVHNRHDAAHPGETVTRRLGLLALLSPDTEVEQRRIRSCR